MNRWLTTRSIVVLALCGFSLVAKPPAGWFSAGSKPADYDISTDPASQYMGLPSVRLKSITPAIKGFGTMMQSMSADQYHGKRIRFSAFVRSEAIEAWAGLWLRVDKGKDSVAFDNMQSRAIKGTSEWKNYQVVLDVPEDATGIAFGILLDGTGSAWINGAKFEVVDNSVPVTDMHLNMTKPSHGPKNLSFEN